MLLQYTDRTNDGRLFRNTDDDLVFAANILNKHTKTKDPYESPPAETKSYEELRAKALALVTPANLNQLKELLEDLSVNIERVTMDHLIDIDTFDFGTPSEKCREGTSSRLCDEINFFRLCYSFLRFYGQIWPMVDNTDVPYGVVMTGITKEAERCNTSINFGVVGHIGSWTIYPAVGLFAQNDRWPT